MVGSVYNNAINAYSSASNMLGNKTASAGDTAERFALPSSEEGSGGDPMKLSFPELLEQSINTSIGSTYKGEEGSIKSLVNRADLHEMVTAVTNAELTLQTVVAVRDKVIGAYQDIIKMPI